MSFSWSPKDILVICQNEADIEALAAAGYTAILQPSPEDFGPMAKAGHYIVAAGGQCTDIAKELVASGACADWRVSLSDLGGYHDLTHAAAGGGVELVREIIRKSKSLYDDEAHPLSAVHKPEKVTTWPTAWTFLEPYVRWNGDDGEFGVFAGPYAGGKSALAQMFACDWADVVGRQIGATASICAWEDAGWRVRRNIERFAVSREDMRPLKGSAMRAKDLLDRVWRITCAPGIGEGRTIEWYLRRCELLLRRQNCRFFVFDPWNQHDETRTQYQTETQYVNVMLRELCAFAHSNKVIMIVVTHISAKSYDEEGGIRPFRIAQAHGSSHFGKMCDRGICVARTRMLQTTARLLEGERDRMIIRFDKAKDEESMGKIDTIAVRYDRNAMEIKPDDAATEEIRDLWRF
jgi:hypothetical protein